MADISLPFTETPGQDGRRFLARARRSILESGVYNMTLRGSGLKDVLGTPPELISGDPSIGQAILDHKYARNGKHVPLPMLARIDAVDDELSAFAHSFDWLSHLRALGSTPSREFARQAIAEWIDIFGRWHAFVWQPEILGLRLCNWLTHYAFFAPQDDDAFKRHFLSIVGRQVRHLARSINLPPTSAGKIKTLKGLIFAGVSLQGTEHYLSDGLDSLKHLLTEHLAADGGHESRSPGTHTEVLKDLVEIRNAMLAAHFEVPDWLTAAIAKMVPILRLMRHPNGRLASFNGGPSIDAYDVDTILAATKVRTSALSAPHSGFYKLSEGKTQIIFDAGRPPATDSTMWGHAGTLAFEMSVGKDVMIVNCGADTRQEYDWRQALRTTAAHSTVVVDEINSSELGDGGGFIRRAENVTASRREVDGSVIIESSHDGYLLPFGLTHRRLLMMAPGGHDIRGEDNLIGTGGDNFAVRFHLHPQVQASMLADGKTVLLKLKRSGWRFSTDDGTISLQESVYCEGDARPRRTNQIVIEGALSGAGATVIWKLSQLSRQGS